MDFLSYELTRTDLAHLSGYGAVYVAFNAAEALAWLTIAAWVAHRATRNGNRTIEWSYALVFAVFGLTDVLEMFAMPLWLLLAKGVVLAMIVLMRRRVLVSYPDKRL